MKHGVCKKCVAGIFVSLLLALVASGVAMAEGACDQPGEAPDVVVGELIGVANYGSIGGVRAYAVGTTSCNYGNCWLNWFASNNNHPVIGQNMFRLADGRFEQIGQSFLKHGFTALAENECFDDCANPGTGIYLGVHCSDPYVSGLNGQQTRLGPKFEVNAATGDFSYPYTYQGQTGNAVYKRLQVSESDLVVPGALYFVEGQYVTPDDAAAGNGNNNGSYRKVTIAQPSFNVSFDGPTVRQQHALWAWTAFDPSAKVVLAKVSGTNEQFLIGYQAKSLGGGQWAYEYAVQNKTSHRSGQSFRVPIPEGIGLSNIGFHDVKYHSGEPYDGTDWAVSIDTSSNPNAIVWETDTFAENENANALRWGTLYNFRFHADVAPENGAVSIGLFRPGSPSELTTTASVPAICDNDGQCEIGEDCNNCPGDCAGGGGECCGDSICEGAEDACSCPVDCGPPPTFEFVCDDTIDDDCDGLTDCQDADCCNDAACPGPGDDNDSDGFGECEDCDDGDGDVWGTPGEALDLVLTENVLTHVTTLTWDGPVELGGNNSTYDTIRSDDPSDFNVAACVAQTPGASSTDAAIPALGDLYYYLVRARSECEIGGDGPLGEDSDAQQRGGTSCP